MTSRVSKDRRDLRAPHPDRTFDRGAALVAGQSRHQVQPCVDRLGEAGKLGAVAEKIGAHRQDDEDRTGRLLLDFQEQVDESGGVIADALIVTPGGPQLPVAKQFFELIDHHQEIDAIVQSRLLENVDQSQLAHAQGGFDDIGQRQAFRRIPGETARRPRQGASHRSDRIGAGPELRHAPRGAGASHQTLAKRRPQPAVHQRGLAAAGRSDDGEKARGGQFVDHGVDLVLPAEEQILLVLPEGPETRKRVRPHRGSYEGSRLVHAVARRLGHLLQEFRQRRLRKSHPIHQSGRVPPYRSCPACRAFAARRGMSTAGGSRSPR